MELALCLEKDCEVMIKIYLPLCGLHYHECVSGKRPEVELRDGYGTAKCNAKTQKIDYPASVPKNRFPLPLSARPQKGLMAFPVSASRTNGSPASTFNCFPLLLTDGPRASPFDAGRNVGESKLDHLGHSGSSGVVTDQSHPQEAVWGDGAPASLLIPTGREEGIVVGVPVGDSIVPLGPGGVKVLACKPVPAISTFYVDSGAGQCLSSCSNAFFSLEPCQIEVVGIAGTLPIFGIGTASFALKLNGKKRK